MLRMVSCIVVIGDYNKLATSNVHNESTAAMIRVNDLCNTDNNMLFYLSPAELLLNGSLLI